jgi:hypothetical protein
VLHASDEIQKGRLSIRRHTHEVCVMGATVHLTGFRETYAA